VPIYEYKCEKGHTFEVLQRMADDSLEKCTVCGARVQRVFHPVAVHFKGSGFYNTDYGKQKGKGGMGDSGSESGSSDSGSSDSKSTSDKGSSDKGFSSSDGAKADKKATSKAASSSD
jgi:putative FmdB family regulatory protein